MDYTDKIDKKRKSLEDAINDELKVLIQSDWFKIINYINESYMSIEINVNFLNIDMKISTKISQGGPTLIINRIGQNYYSEEYKKIYIVHNLPERLLDKITKDNRKGFRIYNDIFELSYTMDYNKTFKVLEALQTVNKYEQDINNEVISFLELE